MKRVSPVLSRGISKKRYQEPVSPLSKFTPPALLFEDTKRLRGPLNSASMDKRMNAKDEAEYRQDILEYMHVLENDTGANADMMDLQPELEWFMRPYLVDFLIEVHSQFKMSAQTLHLAVRLIDRYVSKRIVFKKHYQLVGCCCLWIASKYEDAKDKVPTVRELRTMCCNAYDEDMFTQMEGHILSTLSWKIGHPTVESFLMTEFVDRDDHKTSNLARFFCELSIFYRDFVSLPPSTIARAAMQLSRHITRRIQPCELPEIASTISALLKLLPQASATLRKKYSQPSFASVMSLLEPTTPKKYHPRINLDTPPRTPILVSTGNCGRVKGTGLPTPPSDECYTVYED